MTPTPALLAGGPADIYRELKPKLLERKNIELVEHWSPENRSTFPDNVPANIRLVVILTDYIDHTMAENAARGAKVAKIPFARTNRKWSFMAQALATVGFPNVTHAETPGERLDEMTHPAPPTSTEDFWIPEPEPPEAPEAPKALEEKPVSTPTYTAPKPPVPFVPSVPPPIKVSTPATRELVKRLAKDIETLLGAQGTPGTLSDRIVKVVITAEGTRVTVVRAVEEELG